MSSGPKIDRSIRGRTALFCLEGTLSVPKARELAFELKRAYAGAIEALYIDLEACRLDGASVEEILLEVFGHLLDEGCRLMVFGTPLPLASLCRKKGLNRRGQGLALLEPQGQGPSVDNPPSR